MVVNVQRKCSLLWWLNLGNCFNPNFIINTTISLTNSKLIVCIVIDTNSLQSFLYEYQYYTAYFIHMSYVHFCCCCLRFLMLSNTAWTRGFFTFFFIPLRSFFACLACICAEKPSEMLDCSVVWFAKPSHWQENWAVAKTAAGTWTDTCESTWA